MKYLLEQVSIQHIQDSDLLIMDNLAKLQIESIQHLKKTKLEENFLK